MVISEVSKQINENAHNKGFWEKDFNISEKLMLVVSEVAEAQEADRKDAFARLDKEQIQLMNNAPTDKDFTELFKEFSKDTFEDELADSVIRLLDLAFEMNIDMEKHIELKMRYNSLRPFKHGKKY